MRSAMTMLAMSVVLFGCGAPDDPASEDVSPTGETGAVTEDATPSEEPAESLTPSDEPAPPSPTTPVPTPPASDEEDPADTTQPPTDPASDLVDDAVADLATRLRVEATAIEVLRAEQVTWPDGSLGCPEPGQSYTQAQVDGFRIVLQHDSRVYLYHSATTGPVFLCASDEKGGGHEFVPPPGFHD